MTTKRLLRALKREMKSNARKIEELSKNKHSHMFDIASIIF